MRITSWALLALSVVAVLALTLEPGDTAAVARAGDSGDGRCLLGLPCWAAHAMLFVPVGFGAGGAYATAGWARAYPRAMLAAVFLGGVALSAGTELGQTLVEGRDGNWWDALADLVGFTAGLLATGPLLRRLRGE